MRQIFMQYLMLALPVIGWYHFYATIETLSVSVILISVACEYLRCILHFVLRLRYDRKSTLRNLAIRDHCYQSRWQCQFIATASLNHHWFFSIQATTISDVLVDRATSLIYHIEDRPAEGGRSVLVESVQRQVFLCLFTHDHFSLRVHSLYCLPISNWSSRREIVPKDANIRTGVHEYGTAAAVVNDGIALYSNLTDNRVYKVDVRRGSTAEPVTPGMLFSSCR